MADFIIRPNGDSDWANALFLQAPLPITAQDAAALGLTLGTDYQIGQLGELATFSVTDLPAQMAAPALAGHASSLTVTLASDPADNGTAITGYDVRYSTDQSTWTQVTDITSPYEITGLSNNMVYYVQSRAVNANGGGAWSISANAATAVDIITPVINAISYDDATQELMVDIIEASGSVTAVWATANLATDPTFTIAGGWSGATHETGSFTITSGGDVDTISLTAATPTGARELSLYFYDAAGNLSSPERLLVTVPSTGASLIDFTSIAAADWVTNSRMTVSDTPSKFALALATGGLSRGGVRVDTLFAFDAARTYRFTFPVSAPSDQALAVTAAGNSSLSSSPEIRGPEQIAGAGGANLTVDVPGIELQTELWVGIRIESPGPDQAQTITLDASSATVEAI